MKHTRDWLRTIIVVALERYGAGVIVVIQYIDGIKIIIQGLVAVREIGAHGQAQFAQYRLVALQPVVIVQRLRAHAIVAAMESGIRERNFLIQCPGLLSML